MQTNPMKRPSNIAILVLFVRTAIRRYLNRSALMSRRMKLSAIFSRSAKADDAAASDARTGTRHRDENRSRGRRWLEKAIPAAMLFTFILMGYFAAANILDAYRLREMQSAAKIRIWPEDFARLQKAAAAGDSKLQDLETESVFSMLMGTDGSWLAKGAKETATKKFHDAGLDGFESIHADGVWGGSRGAGTGWAVGSRLRRWANSF